MVNGIRTIVIICSFALTWVLPTSIDADEICSFGSATYLGNHPKEKSPGWAQNAQGMTHGEGDDDAHWYITNFFKILPEPLAPVLNVLWQIPFTHNLADTLTVCGQDGVRCVASTFEPLASYNHFGDPDYYDPHPGDGKGGYVFVPMENQGRNLTGAVAVFRTPDLVLVGVENAHQPEDEDSGENAKHMPWVAFDNQGYLYTSEDESETKSEYTDPIEINKWRVDWNELDSRQSLPDDTEGNVTSFLTWVGDVRLLEQLPEQFPYRAVCESWSLEKGRCATDPDPINNINGKVAVPGELVALGLRRPQGADFSDDGRLLFLMNGLGKSRCYYVGLTGSGDTSLNERDIRDGCGIQVFEVSADDSADDVPCSAVEGDCTALRVTRSTNGSGRFNFEYHPGLPGYEEPEGIDWFDLDRPGAPEIPGHTGGTCNDPITGALLDPCPVSGQLHVLLLDLEVLHDIYIKHYRIGRRNCREVPQQGIQVAPAFHNFDEVPVGGSSRTEVDISNTGNIDFQLEDIAFASGAGAGYELNGVPMLPAILSPGASHQAEVSFAPKTAGRFTAALEIHSDVPDTPFVSVPFAATAIGFPEQVRNLIEALDEGLASGDLIGAGPGDSAAGRAGAIRNKLTTALEYIEAELFENACSELKSALDRADGIEPPTDFVAGPAVTELAAEIAALIGRLRCE